MVLRSDIAALVLAAGYSSRMKEFKPLLPVGPTTALERCIRLFRDAGIQDVRVVIGHRASELQTVLDGLAIRSIRNDRFSEGMFSSVKAGVSDLDSCTRAFFLLPVDIPLIRRSTVLELLAKSDVPPAGFWIPSFLGKRGHPPLISAKWRQEILSWRGGGGLRGFLNKHSSHIIKVPVADEHLSMDMDTPRDYGRIEAAAADYDVPSASECLVLLTETFRVPGPIMAHSSKVAQVALHLARSLNRSGYAINVKLIVAAAMLHDLAKGKPNHAAAAAEVLTELGYPAVADVVASHMDTEALSDQPISPQEVVCFADKVVQAARVVPVEERFRSMLARCSQDPKLSEKVAQRFSRVMGIQARLETALGSPIERVLSSTSSGLGDDYHESLSLEAR
jgi:molybdenum cofactor cytidylyltransferase